MPLNTREKNEIRAGTFVLDALHMELRRSSTSEVVYSGPGRAWQETDGSLSYVLYDTTREKDVSVGSIGRPGTLISGDHLVDLHVRDWRGKNWSAQHATVYTNNVYGEKGVVCHGGVDELILTESGYGGNGEQIQLFIPSVTRIPNSMRAGAKRDEWVVEGTSYILRMKLVDNALEVVADSPEHQFPVQFEDRLIEALWFVLAVPVDWQLMERYRSDLSTFTIRQRPDPPAVPRLQPPLDFKSNDAALHLGRMLLGYLNYISGYHEPRYHPTSVNFRSVLRASATFIETEALVLGIALESLVRKEFKELGKPNDAFCRQITQAIDYLAGWTGSADVKKRIQNAIQSFTGTNPRESMNQLVVRGILSSEQRAAWNKIRHTAAHGMEVTIGLTEVLEYCDLTYEALLRLTFESIGYEGPYTHRIAEGFSDTTYPK